MASVFTYQEDVKRIHSPWSTPGSNTPQARRPEDESRDPRAYVDGVKRLEPEKQDGPCEYKLHLLLRSRRKFVSMTTASDASTCVQGESDISGLTVFHPTEPSSLRSTYQPSPQTRQARLQQLTTQLLWRLQQSSPFHSSSNSELVLPVLPEATPRLGVPDRPEKLLPGLEESQGALYELGVADDGTLVGLADDELDESLNNLRAMAASLGCVCDVLLKSMIGQCTWETVNGDSSDTVVHHGELFAAEVLVRPESGAFRDPAPSSSSVGEIEASEALATRLEQNTEQLRIAFVGTSMTGKSSLVGTLTTSTLDNGRGKSRLSLLKHRHEISSGITSSVAHELIGYRKDDKSDNFVVNYATGDVSSWTDIHNLAERLCFLIDSPGLPRYAKSIYRSMISWQPHWAVFCVAADEEDESLLQRSQTTASGALGSADSPSVSAVSLAQLALCLRLDLPIIVAITKMDLATKSGLRTVLGKVLSMLKTAGRQPVLLSSPSLPIPSFALDSNQALPDLQQISPMEQDEVDSVVEMIQSDTQRSVVPIVMTSSVSGSGIGKLHALLGRVLRQDRLPTSGLSAKEQANGSSLFHIDEVFSIPPSKVYSADAAARLTAHGLVLCGRIETGRIEIGELLRIGPLPRDDANPGFSAPRSKSYSAQDIRRSLTPKTVSVAKSLQDNEAQANRRRYQPQAIFATVRVVSLRNLRLPVLSMKQGETGTIGIELVTDDEAQASLQRARKGMALLGLADEGTAYRSFTATFPATDFVTSSPPLILGGHALAYMGSIRAAVKVTAVALVADDEPEPSSPAEVFAFDDDDGEDQLHLGVKDETIDRQKEITITFRFVSTLEWMQVGDIALIVPTVSASGPVAGQVTTGILTGLTGFVGRINELHV